MQYYIKVFNKATSELVGYYKETGFNRLTKLPKGMRYFNDLGEAVRVLKGIDDGFIRDKDGKYYTGHAIICGDHTREPQVSIYRNERRRIDDFEYENAITTFIRENSGRIR